MVKEPPQSCPQCLHENSPKADLCELCEWPLAESSDEQTVMPEAVMDPDQTIAPGAKPVSNAAKAEDLNRTIAPDHLTENHQTSQEKHTFHLAGDLAHFEVLEILGQGGMGAVYHAKDRTLHRDVALKMLRPMPFSSTANTDALLDEARMASKLNHPNIVTIYDVARAENSHYIVMEWVDGQPLEELIPEAGLPLEQALEYACQIADGLQSAHKKYIIHRDIKPQNIMLTANDTIKILDFGIAGLVNQFEEQTEVNEQEKPATVIGTPSYMSPEQAQGLNLDQRSDIFSFGVVLYQMLSGLRPFRGASSSAITQSVCEGQYKPIQDVVTDLPPRVIALVDKMLATQKDQRWQSTAELAEELHGLHHELTYKKNWWQRQHWLTRVAVLIPFVLALGWSVKEILFPASTQQLIERQLAEATKIAILPFENISGDPLIQLFGDGLAVNLGSDLAAIAQEQGNTWIVPATEIARMKEPTPQQVVDKYGVNLILTGSMQHMGSTRLMVLNLINGANGQQLRTTEVEINADELFAGHDAVRSKALELLNWEVPVNISKQFEQARPQLDGAYREYVQSRGLVYRYDQADNLDQAMIGFQQALAMDANYENAYVGLAEVQLLQYAKNKDVKWLDAVSTTLQRLESINSDNEFINYLLAEEAMKRGNYQSAVDLYQSTVDQSPVLIKAQRGLATAYSKLGDRVNAERVYQEASLLAPNDWGVVAYFGIFYFQNGDYQKALDKFIRLIEMSPNNHFGYRNTAGAYYALGEIDNAIIYTKLAIDIKPSDRAYSNLGTMLFYVKKYDEAILAYQQAVALNENNYLHWGNLADAYKLNKDEKRVESFQKAIELAKAELTINPNETLAQATLAYYLSNVGAEVEAVKYAQKINASSSGIEHFLVATAYDQLNQVGLALDHIEMALSKNYPKDEIQNTPLLVNVRSHLELTELLK